MGKKTHGSRRFKEKKKQEGLKRGGPGMEKGLEGSIFRKDSNGVRGKKVIARD